MPYNESDLKKSWKNLHTNAENNSNHVKIGSGGNWMNIESIICVAWPCENRQVETALFKCSLNKQEILLLSNNDDPWQQIALLCEIEVTDSKNEWELWHNGSPLTGYIEETINTGTPEWMTFEPGLCPIVVELRRKQGTIASSDANHVTITGRIIAEPIGLLPSPLNLIKERTDRRVIRDSDKPIILTVRFLV